MPPARSASSPKRPGGKAPGAVRAKSGCYTCRIRRKKCDEKQDSNGHCETCVRLKIQCLGFGAKRPEWLRENSRVVELREKIKHYLASQGMIKGHSGSGPRSAEQEAPYLVLNIYGDECSSATESPSTPSLTLSPPTDTRYPQAISDVRGSSPTWVTVDNMEYPPSGLMPSQPPDIELVEDYPHVVPYNNDHLLHQFGHMTQSHTLSSAAPSTWNTTSASTSMSLTQRQSYQHQPQLITFEDMLFADSSYPEEQVPTIWYKQLDNLLTHYATHVIPIEYLLADKRTHNALIQAFTSYGIAGDAARLLSHVHQIRSQPLASSHRALDYPEINVRYNSLKQIFSKPQPNEDDAFAALQVISAFLFDGGTGVWRDWLSIAWAFCDSILYDPKYLNPIQAILSVPETTRFIVLTSMWFDVLASVTLGEPPHFLGAFRYMYNPNSAHIEGSSIQELSMMPIMGCENLTVWALAEISNLAKWKEEEVAFGRLSVPRLVEKAAEIERHLISPHVSTYGGQDDLEVDSCRIIASRIFRSSARVYLHSVVSGSRPSVPEIQAAVADTIDIINQVPETGASGMSRSVMRSTVFSIFICGALTDRPEQRDILLDRLKNQNTSEGVGNCNSVWGLLQNVWMERDRARQPHAEVPWRSALKKAQILLV